MVIIFDFVSNHLYTVWSMSSDLTSFFINSVLLVLDSYELCFLLPETWEILFVLTRILVAYNGKVPKRTNIKDHFLVLWK